MKIELDGAKMIAIEEAHQYLAEKFEFPDCYGNNLNALWDMLTTIHKETKIKIYNLDFFLAHSSYKQKLIDLFIEASDNNKYLEVNFISGEKPEDERPLIKFSWIAICVKDIEESVLFYEDILGLEINRKFKTSGQTEAILLGNEEIQVKLVVSTSKEESERNTGFALVFLVDSLAKTIELLNKNNIEIIERSEMFGEDLKYLFIVDPNGIKIKLLETN